MQKDDKLRFLAFSRFAQPDSTAQHRTETTLSFHNISIRWNRIPHQIIWLDHEAANLDS